jgi:hypothetical protein
MDRDKLRDKLVAVLALLDRGKVRAARLVVEETLLDIARELAAA